MIRDFCTFQINFNRYLFKYEHIYLYEKFNEVSLQIQHCQSHMEKTFTIAIKCIECFITITEKRICSTNRFFKIVVFNKWDIGLFSIVQNLYMSKNHLTITDSVPQLKSFFEFNSVKQNLFTRNPINLFDLIYNRCQMLEGLKNWHSVQSWLEKCNLFYCFHCLTSMSVNYFKNKWISGETFFMCNIVELACL